MQAAAHSVDGGRILVTGARGLIGRALCHELRIIGRDVAELDIRGDGTARGDVRRSDDLRRVMNGCAGVVHLAAVSRVVWGERDPASCRETNVGGTMRVLEIAAEQGVGWVLLASSREVYGEPTKLPVIEDAPLAPVNVYGRSKQAAEQLVLAAGGSVVRLSNVYGDALDHPDRVVPAFVRAALVGGSLRVDGPHNLFDFVHVDDAVRGIVALVKRLEQGAVLPPIHLVTGVGTTLGALAASALALGDAAAAARHADARDFDVTQFVGDPTRARELLDWQARISLDDGLGRLAAAMSGSGLVAGSPSSSASPR